MVTPLFDIDVGTLYLIGQKLELVLIRTAEEIGWENGVVERTNIPKIVKFLKKQKRAIAGTKLTEIWILWWPRASIMALIRGV